MNTYIVALNEGVDYDQFWLDMESPTSGLPHIPDRVVSITNDRPVFDRICEYALTDDEANRVRNDPRVYSIDQPVENLPFISIQTSATQADNFTKPPESWSSHNSTHPYVNWGLPRHSNPTNIYANNSSPAYTYGLDGTGVDVIINDSGIQADHPEFTDANGVSRVVQVPWNRIATAANLTTKTGWDEASYVYGNNPIAEGHGTHVAGIVAGKTYGWAKNAAIVSLNAFHGSVLDLFELIYRFHTTKGNGRPTVVNMSWGFFIRDYSAFGFQPSVRWRGNVYAYNGSGESFYTSKGFLFDPNGVPNITPEIGSPYYSGAYNTALGHLVDAGIIICKAAGNSGFKKDVVGGADYNNQIGSIYGNFYYHRGASPTDTRILEVGNIDSVNSNNLDQAAEGSVKGPGVDIWAAGTNIMSSWPKNAQDIISGVPQTGSDYFKQPGQGWKQYNDSGTSMASPQVAGMCALYLQKYPTSTPAEVKNWLLSNATNTILNTGTDIDYKINSRSLLGGAPRVAYQNLQGLTKSYIKDSTNTWREAKAVWVKHTDGTWKQAKSGWQKNDAGTWIKIYEL